MPPPPDFAPVSWQYQDEATSAKLQQMIDNTVAHDHRADGTQGASMVGQWVTIGAAMTARSGWSIITKRYRHFLGGAIVALDLVFQRTGAQINITGDGGNNPGNLFGGSELTATLPVEARPESQTWLHGERSGNGMLSVRVDVDGPIVISGGTTSGKIYTGDQIVVRGLLWRA